MFLGYPLIISKDEGKFKGRYPNFPEIFITGDSIDGVIDSCRDILLEKVDSFRGTLPLPFELSKIIIDANDYIFITPVEYEVNIPNYEIEDMECEEESDVDEEFMEDGTY